jgi:hypothetical protein
LVGEVGVPDGANGLFTVVKHAINPGLKATFPFLHKIARNFERYAMHSLAYEILPSVAATTPGIAHILGDVDPADRAPTSKVEAYALPVAQRGQVWQKTIANMKPLTAFFKLAKGAFKHVRTGAHTAADPTSINDYDCGNVYTGTEGVIIPEELKRGVRLLGNAIGTPTGELWLSYTCDLVNPSLSDKTGFEPGFYHFMSFNDSVGALTRLAPFAIANLWPGQEEHGPLKAWVAEGSNYYTLPDPGEYQVTIQLEGTGLIDTEDLVASTAMVLDSGVVRGRLGDNTGIDIGGYGNASAAGTRWQWSKLLTVALDNYDIGFTLDCTPIATTIVSCKVVALKVNTAYPMYPPTFNDERKEEFIRCAPTPHQLQAPAYHTGPSGAGGPSAGSAAHTPLGGAGWFQVGR